MKINFLLAIVTPLFFLQCASNGKEMNKKDTITQDAAPLLETYWKLIEINGQPVSNPSGDQKEAYIQLKQGENRIVGSGGCNTLSGSYELMDGNRLRFTGVASTRMACPDMTLEDGLNRSITMADNYAIEGKHLMLHKAKMAPLAKFEAITDK